MLWLLPRREGSFYQIPLVYTIVQYHLSRIAYPYCEAFSALFLSLFKGFSTLCYLLPQNIEVLKQKNEAFYFAESLCHLLSERCANGGHNCVNGSTFFPLHNVQSWEASLVVVVKLLTSSKSHFAILVYSQGLGLLLQKGFKKSEGSYLCSTEKLPSSLYPLVEA